MPKLRDMSIRRKLMLIIMAISTLALIVACTVFVQYEMKEARRKMLRDIDVLADFIGYYSTAPLDFGDPEAARETLAALQAEPHIVSATIFDGQGQVFASYATKGSEPSLAHAASDHSTEFTARHLDVCRAITQNQEEIGALHIRSDRKEERAILVRSAEVALVVILVSSLVAFALSSLLQRVISSPIEDLLGTTKAVSEDKDYAVRAEKQGEDELGALVDGFNEMLEQIHLRDQELRSHQERLEHEVAKRTAELTLANHELVIAKEEAEEASRAKSTFLASVSHELRTPLSAVIGYSELMEEEAQDRGQEEFIPDLLKIRSAGRDLLTLIDQILDFSKIEAGRMEVYLETFEVSGLVEEIASTAKPLVNKNSNRLRVECPGPIGQMKADRTKVRRSLLNLLGNAAKFTEDGEVALEVSRETENGQDWMCFRVSDTGLGMSPEQMGRIFEAFAQGDASTTRRYGGTGLGLTITQRFCEMQGGTVSVESDPGRGSSFSIRLPAEVSASYVMSQVGLSPDGPDDRGAASRPRSESLDRNHATKVLVMDGDTDAKDSSG